MNKWDEEAQRRIEASKKRLSHELEEHLNWLEQYWQQEHEEKQRQLRKQWDKDRWDSNE